MNAALPPTRIEELAAHRALVMALAHALGIGLAVAERLAEPLVDELAVRGLTITRS